MRFSLKKMKFSGDMSGGKRPAQVKAAVLLLTYLMFQSSCSVKKFASNKSVSGQNSINVSEVIDSDADGIPDEIERKNATNPFIADIPKISISEVQNISIGAVFKKNESSAQSTQFQFLNQTFLPTNTPSIGDIDSLRVLRSKVVKNQYNFLRNVKTEKVDLITNEDLRSDILSSWPDSNFYSFIDELPESANVYDNESGKFTTSFKIKISNALNVSEISNISIKSFFYDYQKMEKGEIYNHFLLKASGSKESYKLTGRDSFYPVGSYSLVANELKSTEIYNRLQDRSEIGIKFNNFDYTKSGIPLNYEEVLSKVFDQDARIVISTKDKTEVFFVAPEQTLYNVLIRLGRKVKLNKDGEIDSIDNIESKLTYPLDIDTMKIDELANGMWSIFGDGEKLSDTLRPQGLYVVSFASGDEIINAKKTWGNFDQNEVVDNFTIDQIFAGDELLLDSSDLTKTYIAENLKESTYELGNCNFLPGLESLLGGSGSCKYCHEIRSTLSQVEQTINIPSSEIVQWFKFTDSYGKDINASVFKYGGKILLKFNSLQDHLRNKITISFAHPLDKISSARTGLITSTCSQVSTIKETQPNIFKIKGSFKLRTLNNY